MKFKKGDVLYGWSPKLGAYHQVIFKGILNDEYYLCYVVKETQFHKKNQGYRVPIKNLLTKEEYESQKMIKELMGIKE